jgi:AbrB family looped-hinge helix DNA binding protein
VILPRSKVTSQGQISIPVQVRKKLGITPGSILEWEEEGDNVVVRRAGTFSSQDIHEALFSRREPQHKNLEELKDGIRQFVRKRHAGR